MVNLAAVSLHRHIAVLADFSFQVIFQVFGVWGSGDMYIQADVASLVGLSLCAISPKLLLCVSIAAGSYTLSAWLT